MGQSELSREALGELQQSGCGRANPLSFESCILSSLAIGAMPTFPIQIPAGRDFGGCPG